MTSSRTTFWTLERIESLARFWDPVDWVRANWIRSQAQELQIEFEREGAA